MISGHYCPNILTGLVQGSGTSHSGSFGSSNTRDLNLEGAGIRAATMRGSYVPNKSFTGTVAYFNGEEESFTSTYDANSATLSNLSQVAGTYTGVHTGNHSVTVTVDASGRLSGHSSDGCTVVGTLSPRPTGHVFHTSVTVEGATCHAQTETLTGGDLLRRRETPSVQCGPQPCQDHQLSLSRHEAVSLTGSLCCQSVLIMRKA